MNKLKIGHISKIFLLILSLQNGINIVLNQKPLTDFIKDVAVFLIFILILVVLEQKFSDKKIHSILFLVSGIMGQLLTTQGNFAPVVFFCMAIYCFNHKRFTVIALILALLSLFVKSIINHFGTNDIINLLMIEALMFFYYYKLWHPKEIQIKFIKGFSEDDMEILQGVINGKHNKQIADEMNIPYSTLVNKRKKLRDKFGFGSDGEMIYKLTTTKVLEEID